MADVDPETLLEWLQMGQGDERDMQLIALEQLCMLLLMSDNVDRVFESCPPRTFLPALCRIFLDECAPDNVLEVTARAITYYLDVSAECTRRIVAVDGAVKSLCNRLVVVEMSSRTSRDLSEQCIKVLERICSRESGAVFEAGGLNCVLTFIREHGSQVHKDTLHSAMSVVSRLCGKMEPQDTSLEVCVKSLSTLLEHDDQFVADGALKCFASLADRFTRKGVDPAPLAKHGLIEELLQRLERAGDPGPNASVTSTPGSLTMTPDAKCSPSISTVISLLSTLCRGSPDITHNLLRSDLPDAIESGLKGDERCCLDTMRLVDLLLVLLFEGRTALPKSGVSSITSRIASLRRTDSTGERSHRQLIDCIRSKDTDALIDAVDNGFEVNFMDDVGQTLLNWASAFGTQEMVEFLCERGADVNRGLRSSSLHYAACFGRPQIVKTLLRYGANPDLRDEDGKTPLDKARERGDEGHKEVIQILQSPGEWMVPRDAAVTPAATAAAESTEKEKKEEPVPEEREDPTEPKGDPEVAPLYLKQLLPVFTCVFQSTMLPSVRKSSLSLLKKMVHYMSNALLLEICNPELSMTNFAGPLTEVLTNVLDHEEDDEGHQVVLHIIQDLMKKGQEIFLEHFARLGLFGRVLNLAGPIDEEERVKPKEDKEDEEPTAEDATEVIQGRPYHWKDWCIVRGRDCLYLWSDAAALELSNGSNGWFRFILDSKLATMYSSGSPEGGSDSSENRGEFLEKLQRARSQIKAGTPSQPILSHVGSSRLSVGNWSLACRKEGEIQIHNSDGQQVDKQATILKEELPGFIFESNRGTKHSFTAETSLGPEFSTGWSGKKSKKFRSKSDEMKIKVKNQARDIYEQYFREAEAMPRGVVARIRSIVQQLEASCAKQISQVRLENSAKDVLLKGEDAVEKKSWLFNNDRKKLLDKGSRLKISGLTAEDNGIYSCRAENVAGEKDSSVNFLLNVQAPNTPHLIESQFTKSLLRLKNQEARLDCPFVNATRVDWFSNYEKISNSSRHQIFSNGSLYFPRVRLSDEGSYRCEGLTDNRDIPAQTFTSELILSNLGDFRTDSFEPRLIRNYPIVIPLHNRFVVKVFPPSGQPTPRLRWLDKNDLEVGQTGRIHVQDNNLVFSNPQQIDSGNYTCIVENSVGEKRQNVWIIVSVPPRISKAPQPKEVEEGGNVQFSCQVTGTPYPVTTIIWMKGSELIKMGSSRHHINKMHGLLSISNVKSEDIGTYACVANTTGQKLVESSRAYLRVRKKLQFNPIPSNTFIEYKTDEQVSCKAEGDGQVIVQWMKDSSLNIAPHVTNVDGTLYFHDVKKTDEGLYTCIAHSDQQGFINATVYIAVVERPRIQTRPHNTTVVEGQTAMLHCVAIGDPRPEIKWDKDSFTDGFNYERVTFFPNGTLKVSQVYIEDRGKYGCTAKNKAGNIRMEAYLDVKSSQDLIKSTRAVEEAGFSMMKTIIIAVCSAGAYLALVIGLTAFCSYRLLIQKRNRKSLVKSENGDISREQHELLMKDRDSESRTPFRSDSDNRSHVSGMSSHPSHSSQSQTHSQAFSRSRRGSYDSLQFPRHDLQTLGMLGRGVFGDVFLAKARAIRDGEPETLVVVKSLLTRDESLYFEYRQELDMYAKLDHPNISHVLGICRDMEPQFVISEYCDWGDLKQFLLATRSDNGRRIPRVPPLNTAQKLSMCKQVAAGMEHIANHRFVHRDLAARNVLLTSRSELKISSLSLCKDVYKGEYYQHNQNFVPLRWMPPEAAIEDDFSTKSDVWSYGVFVWEVFHLADLPYANMMDEEILKRLKVGDIQLEMSDQCPSEITDLIRKCMTDCPRDRPLFSELSIHLAEMVSGLPVLPPVMLQPSMAV